jgi:hypothetical protein
MTPGQASEKGKVLIIEHPEGWRSIAPHVFDLPGGGIAFIDDGWTDPLLTSHPVHIIEDTFFEFSMGWGATRSDGEDIFIEEHTDAPRQEGSRDRAREELLRVFDISLK